MVTDMNVIFYPAGINSNHSQSYCIIIVSALSYFSERNLMDMRVREDGNIYKEEGTNSVNDINV